MTIKQFMKLFVKIIKKDGRFIPQLADKYYKFDEDEIALLGEDENEVFAFKVIKVEPD